MSHSSELNSYIGQVERRLRIAAWTRGSALFMGTALTVTVALVLLLDHFAFPASGVGWARIGLLLALAASGLTGLALPLARLTRARAVARAEGANPDLERRLTTFHDHAAKGEDPFLELLAADTLAHTRATSPASLVPDARLFALAGAGMASLLVLVWMIAARPGYVGYGASLLWTGGRNAAPLYAISITPGNATVRRNSDQLITAHVAGMRPDNARLFARYASSSGWEPVAMLPLTGAANEATFQFVFAGLPESVEYYVHAGPLVSPHYQVRVVDLATVKNIRVTYRYPAWTGMKPATVEHVGDLRAIEGTEAEIDLQMDRPLQNGQLTLDDGRTVALRGDGRDYRGVIRMQRDGAYHVSTHDQDQAVRLSEDYFIATDKAVPPAVAIERPTGDYRASPIEEVTVGLKAADPFGLRDLHLHYAVNGGADRDISLLKTAGAKSADGDYTIPLEDFKLKPGDLVSLYATAKDGHSETRTDISFIQVDPFEREFSQSQQSGGGAGGGGTGESQIEISKREKELIAATWKQENDKTATAKDAAAQGQFLAGAQQKLRDQVNALSVRMQSRDLSEANNEFTDFAKDMQDAAAAMAPSAEKLQNTQWKDAMPLEQKALQALLRAEATFRQIQVAFGAGGGGGGANSAGRDLASLFDLELDTEKNQYETAQTASPAEQHAKDIEDALEKLDALAKRQQDLAHQQANPQQGFAERWQQEMLRREAEQLARQLEQMAQNGQQSPSPSASGSSGAKGDQAGAQRAADASGDGQPRSAGSDSSPAGNSDPRIGQALSRLRGATEAMRRGDSGARGSASQQAAEALREAQNLLAGSQQQLSSDKVGSMAREAQALRQQEQAQAGRINQLAQAQTDQGAPTDLDGFMNRRRERDQLAGERQQLSDRLSELERNLRDTARAMAPNQPGVAQELRDALSEMDDSDLDNRVQRTADWLRRGINPNAGGTESDIAQGLGKLTQQLAKADQDAGREKPSPQGDSAGGDQTALLDKVESLRAQIESMSRAGTGRESGRPSGAEPSGAPGETGPTASGRAAGRGSNPARGDLGNQALSAGLVPPAGARGAQGTAWNNINTGNNRYGGAPRPGVAPADASGNPADGERTFQQEIQELGQIRRMAQGDPQTAKEIAELTRQMMQLDPRRFPGNPALVEQMHREMLSSVNRLELELERAGAARDARSARSDAIPAGYQDSVADYYRRLSKNQ